MLPEYEVYALRYARVDRHPGENFIGCAPQGAATSMDYFVWLIKNQDRTILVDTGFDQAAARERQREFLRCPIDYLQHFNLQPDHITDLVLTHLHYDHAGNVSRLPQATIHLQEQELHFVTSSHMKYALLRNSYSARDVLAIVQGLFDQQVQLYAGDTHLAPGIELIHIGGHTRGLQSVRVHTRRGWLVIASDASHYYDNIYQENPFPIVFHVGDMLKGFDRIKSLAGSKHHIIPGHDPKVMQYYPRTFTPEIDIVSLHESPVYLNHHEFEETNDE